MAFSPGGDTLASSSRDGTARLWNVATGAEMRRLEGTPDPFAVALSPDGKMLASGWDYQTVRLWNVATGAAIRKLEGHIDDVSSLPKPVMNTLSSGIRPLPTHALVVRGSAPGR